MTIPSFSASTYLDRFPTPQAELSSSVLQFHRTHQEQRRRSQPLRQRARCYLCPVAPSASPLRPRRPSRPCARPSSNRRSAAPPPRRTSGCIPQRNAPPRRGGAATGRPRAWPARAPCACRRHAADALVAVCLGTHAAAAEALGQAASGAAPDVADAVQAILLKHLRAERDQGVTGAVCRTLGRMPYATPQAAGIDRGGAAHSRPCRSTRRRAGFDAATERGPRIRVAAAAQREAVHAVTGNGQATDADGARAPQAAPRRRSGGCGSCPAACDGGPFLFEAG